MVLARRDEPESYLNLLTRDDQQSYSLHTFILTLRKADAQSVRRAHGPSKVRFRLGLGLVRVRFGLGIGFGLERGHRSSLGLGQG